MIVSILMGSQVTMTCPNHPKISNLYEIFYDTKIYVCRECVILKKMGYFSSLFKLLYVFRRIPKLVLALLNGGKLYFLCKTE